MTAWVVEARNLRMSFGATLAVDGVSLAVAPGQAYGLVGDHRQWAKMPQATLAQQIAEAKSRVMAAKPAAVEVAADPFASAVPAAGGQWAPAPAQYGQGMDQAFANVNAQQYGMAPAGVPQSKPVWIIPVIVAAFVLVVGGGIAVFALMR